MMRSTLREPSGEAVRSRRKPEAGSRYCVLGPGGGHPGREPDRRGHALDRAADAMGRASLDRLGTGYSTGSGQTARAWRERPSRTSTSSAQALSPGLRRPAGPASSLSLPGFLSRLRRAAARGALAALLLAGAGTVAAPASAAELVGNIGQSGDGAAQGIASYDHAQGFTTGSNSGGYTLTDIQIVFGTGSKSGISVKLATGLPSSTTEVVTLSNPSLPNAGGTRTFTAPTDTTLSADTEYWVIVEGTAGIVRSTTSDSEDSGGMSGWEVADGLYKRDADSTGEWTADTATNLRIRVNGSVLESTAPTVSSAEVTAAKPKELVLTFSKALATGSVPAASQFTVKVGGSAGPAVSSVAIDGDKVKLVLAVALDAGQTGVTVDYAKPATNPLKDDANNEVAGFTGQAVINNAPACPSGQPAAAFWTACLTIGKWESIQLTTTFYGFTANRNGALSDEEFAYEGENFDVTALNRAAEVFVLSFGGSNPATGRFVLQVGATALSFGAGVRTPIWELPAALAWTDANVGDKVSVSLRQVAAPQTRMLGGRVVRAGLPFLYVLRNDTFGDPAGAGLTYSAAQADGSLLPAWLTFDARKRTLRGTPTNAEVTGPDERIQVAFTATDGNGGQQVGVLSIGVVPDEDAPAIQSVMKGSRTLTVTYNEPLDEESTPGGGAFAVTDGNSQTVAVSSVDVTGRNVVLTLAAASEVASVNYTVPTGANAKPIRDVAGNDAAQFDRTVEDFTVSLRALQSRVSEGAESAGFEISLDPVPTDPKVAFFVHWETVPGTAVPHWLSQTGADYTATGGGIALGNGGGSKPTYRVWVPIADDGLDEPDETFGLRIALGFGPDQTDIVNPTSAPAYVKDLAVSVDTAEAEVTIEDNDSGPSVTLRAPGGRLGDDIREGDEEAAFGVWLLPGTGSVSYPVTVNYAVRALTAAEAAEADGRTRATAGTDFTAATGMVTFNTGETHKAVPVDVPRTPELEGDEYFAVELSGPSGNLDIEESLGLYLIYDNPGPYKSRMGVGSGAPPESEGGGCGANLWVEFRDGNGERTQVSSLAATDFAVENARIGAPVADADGLRWTVPAWATAGFTGLMRVRLVEKAPAPEGRVTAWEAAEQVLRVASDTDCAAVARSELASLALEGLELDPAFDAATTAYTAAAPEDTETVTVKAAAVYGTSDVAIAPADADTDAEGHQVTLAEGGTGIAVTVTPGDGSAAQTWTVTVTGASDAGVLTGFVLVDASNDADLGAVESGGTVTVSASGSYGIRAGVEADAEVGSVVLTLAGPGAEDTHTRTESIAPYSLYGDDMQGAEHGRALPAGTYTLTATAYADRGGAGDVLGTLAVPFTVAVEAAPGVLTGFVLVDAATDEDLGAIADGGTVSVSAAGRYGIRAETQAGAEVGSVVLTLAGPGADDVHERTENVAPYSLYGDAGGAEHGRALAVGSYTLTATAHAERGGAGRALGALTVAFTAAASTAPLTASLQNLPERHDGATAFSFELRLSEHVAVLRYKTVRDDALAVTGGEVTDVRRIAPQATDKNRRWEITVEPDSFGDVAVTLPATTDCEAAGAVCHADGRMLSAAASGTVPGPALSVADARAEEGTDATLDFAVTLVPARTAAVTVEYATADGTATAGSDYTATSGTLTFAAGETQKTVSVPVLDDDTDEGSETLTLRLSNAQGANIADGEATGTITNSDAIPRAWLARFGRTVTGQVLDAVQDRLAAPRAAGAEASLAGLAMPSWKAGDGEAAAAAAAEREAEEARQALASMTAWLSQADGDDGGREPESRALTERDFITGTSFALTGGSAQGGGFASLWGRGSIAGFDGREGSLTVDGEVTTALVGADWASDPGSGAGRWTAGLAVGHSTGTGGWRGANGSGAIEAVLTGLYPYAGMDLTERLSVWAAAGHGSGEVTVTSEGEAGLTANLTMSMGAAGVRSDVLRPESGDGLLLALKGDARFTRTSSEAVRSEGGNLAAADADVWLLRTGLEGSRPVALGEGGATLTPTFELGLRLDGGDAETGMGADLGGGLAFADPTNGLVFESRARALVAHEADGFREWGASLSASWDPRPSTDRGLSLSLTQSWGASPGGGMDALLGRETLADLAANDEDGGDGFRASSRLEGELGYGLPAFGGAFTGTPNVGLGLSETARDWRIGWRLTSAIAGDPGFEVSLDATRSEPVNDDARPEHGVMLRGALRW